MAVYRKKKFTSPKKSQKEPSPIGSAANDNLNYKSTNRGVVVNFYLGERFPRHRPQQQGSLRPRARARWVREGVANPRKTFWDFWCQIPRLGAIGPGNKLIEGQPNEYDVICWNTSVLAFHLWPLANDICPRDPFRLQNICRNGVPPRSRTTTPLSTRLPWLKTETEHFNVIWLSYLFISIICQLTGYHVPEKHWRGTLKMRDMKMRETR